MTVIIKAERLRLMNFHENFNKPMFICWTLNQDIPENPEHSTFCNSIEVCCNFSLHFSHDDVVSLKTNQKNICNIKFQQIQQIFINSTL